MPSPARPELRLRGVMAVPPMEADPDVRVRRLAEMSPRLRRDHPGGGRDLGRDERRPRRGDPTRLDTRACRYGVARPPRAEFRLASETKLAPL